MKERKLYLTSDSGVMRVINVSTGTNLLTKRVKDVYDEVDEDDSDESFVERK